MGNFKRFCFVILLFVCSTLCFAKQISFQIVQHDDAAEEVTESSLTIEDEILNTFFDYGFIVTNSEAKISSVNGVDEKLYKIGVGDAFNGYSDYFIQINLFYNKNEDSISIGSDLTKVNFLVASVQTGEIFADKTFNNIKLGNQKDDLKKVSSDLVLEINKVLKSKKA